MKKIHILEVTAFTLVMTTTGYTADIDDEEAKNFSSTMTKSEDKPGMMGEMHGKGMMHKGMMGHHMMHSGMSPVTVVVHPGMMPMMGHGMMQQSMMQREKDDGHKGCGMSQEKMEQRQSMMKKHMELMEQRLANIEALLGELVELQKKN